MDRAVKLISSHRRLAAKSKERAEYKAAGNQSLRGTLAGPDEAQLHELKAAGMPVICTQNSLGLAQKDNR